MWKKGVTLPAVIFFFLCLNFTVVSSGDSAQQEIIWKDVSSGIKDLDLQAVAVSPDNPEVVYVSSSHVIYKTLDGGKSWNEVLSFRGTGNTINSIAINPKNAKVIYAGIQDGLFVSKDRGKNWKRIFRGIGELESSILSIAINPVNPDLIFIGTRAGLFRTDNRGNNWEKGQGLPSESMVISIAIDHSKPYIIYVATQRGLYKGINSGIDWERIFETSALKDDATEEDSATEQSEPIETNGTEIRYIIIDPAITSTIYMGTSEGLLVTEDSGLSWKMVSSSGLISNDIRHLVISPTDPHSVYSATSRGVFRYSKVSKAWDDLYKGLTSIDIRFLASAPFIQDGAPTLWAVTKGRVFKTISITEDTPSERMEMKAEKILSMFAHEPSITEIQKAAIRYAEVHPEKIEDWRKAAAKKAWLPQLSIGLDRNVTDLWHWDTGSTTTDDVLRRGRGAVEWDITVSWNLGDLIWNDDQTSIDTRSRLMVQLRDDVLNEVTRLYFERRRLQIEMLSSPSKDLKDKMEKELRLQELTADIDALTGFYLSRRLGQLED